MLLFIGAEELLIPFLFKYRGIQHKKPGLKNMEKHLTLRETSDEEKGSPSQPSHHPSPAFSASHLSALREGASRRKKEQLVGNWIRVTNPSLFAQLLVEASAVPVSIVLDSIDSNDLFKPKNSAPSEAVNINPYAPSAPSVKNDAYKGGQQTHNSDVSNTTYPSRPPLLNIR